ncbi:restriction endonuclease subunit S [Rhizobium sp. NPDC090275]|uniref:restriction endonuclease subunit S n=1 Tax=Rhizobium sp. NPDC090275 TaxID=3364498 RepID=UPI003839D0DC
MTAEAVSLFLGQFSDLSRSPSGTKRLKELVLQLAVRGRLVGQSSDDSSVEDLLVHVQDTIRTDIARGVGVARKKLEKSPAPPPYPLPKGWAWKTLDEISSYIQRGRGPQYVDNSNVRIVSQKCIQWSGFTEEPCKLLDEDAFSNYGPERVLAEGDLLWNSTGTGTIGRVNVFPERTDNAVFVADSHVTVVRIAVVNPRYVWCFLASPTVQSTIEGDASGSTNQVELSGTYVRNCWVPIPPLAEQDRIVSKVDELMQLCDELDYHLREDARLSAELMDSLLHHITEPDPGNGGGTRRAHLLAKSTELTKHSNAAPSQKNQSSLRLSDARIKEAVLASAVVNSFFEDGGEPIGNFRLQKAVYFARRHLGDYGVDKEYLKKAAGPYNPTMKYSGGIAIAKAKEWIFEAKGRYGFGHIPGPAFAEVPELSHQLSLDDAVQWVREKFKRRRNEEWEVLATVDFAVSDLKNRGHTTNPATVLEYISRDAEWSPKIGKLGLTEESIDVAMHELSELFGGAQWA